MEYAIGALAGLLIGFAVGRFLYSRYVTGEEASAKTKAAEIAKGAEAEAERLVKDATVQALRLVGGHFVNNSRPRERIPFSEDGHSEFLTDVSLKAWIRRHSPYVEIDGNGMLTWKSTPS